MASNVRINFAGGIKFYAGAHQQIAEGEIMNWKLEIIDAENVICGLFVGIGMFECLGLASFLVAIPLMVLHMWCEKEVRGK